MTATRSTASLAASLGLLLSACSGNTVYRDFVYEPQVMPGASDTGLKIAFLSFDDEREEHDDGSHAWTHLPGVLYATESSDDRQTESDRYGTDYYFPDLLPYTLALDLVASGVSRRVDIAPPALEDYDVVVHGVIHSTEVRNQRYSYGLGPAKFLTKTLALPQGEQAALYQVSYRVFDARGEKLGELRVEREWSPLYWDEDRTQPTIQGVVENVRSGNEEALAWLVALLDRAPLAPHAEAVDRRVRLYHERLDPELAALVDERDRARSDGMAGYAEVVDREIHRRARLLEKYRRVEQKVIAKQQEFVYESQYRRLAQIGEYRAAQREAQASASQARREYDQAQRQQIASALVGGLIPLMSSMSSFQASTPDPAAQSARMDAAVRRAGEALSSIEPVPPPPDVGELMAGIEMDMSDHASAGAAVGGISGNNIVQIRRRFLDRYRAGGRSIAELREAYLRNRG